MSILIALTLTVGMSRSIAQRIYRFGVDYVALESNVGYTILR